MKPIIRFTSLAPLIAAIGLLVLLVPTSTLLAQKNLFRCPHGIIDGDDGTGKCSLCGRGDEERRRKEKQDREEAIKKAKKEAEEVKDEADRANAKQIENQVNQLRNNSSVRQFNTQPWDAQRRSLLNNNPSAFKSQAEQLEERARELRNQATDARRNDDRATGRALDSAASELDSQSSAARSLGIRATMEQNSEKFRIESAAKKAESDRYWDGQRAKNKAESDRYWAAQRAKDDADHDARMKTISEQRQATLNPHKEFQKDIQKATGEAIYDNIQAKDTVDRVKALEKMRDKTVDYIQGPVWHDVDNILNNPNAEPRRSDPSRGYPSGINPGSSGGGSRAPYNPPATLPRFAPPSASQPITDQDVNRDFETLKSGSGGRPAPRIPLVPMPPEPKPNPTPPPAASPDPTVFDTFKKWLGDLGKPAPSPSPTPTPPPVNLLEPRSK